ncbi:MAG: hypothetical protein B7Y80_16990 [Hyphomicrobium sp. 32-62-53]|nr:MAG: hypothetical protein B7Z29_08100 [Hyphomicrobium sp. 12-62-95]OYX98071.1 MAG: hypothetical protein B7Y80_16990 [Hyphomicrobium sp. 32-62-53]
MASGFVDLLTVGAVGTIAFGVGVIVLFNISSTMPKDPIVAKALCFLELPYESDEGSCFKTRLKQGLSEMERVYEQQKQQREQEFQQKERELDATIQKRTEELAALDQRRQTLEGEKAQITQARSELEGQIKKLEEIERASTSFNLFSEKSWKRGLKVTTGIEYKSFVQSQDWTKSWCYVQFDMDNGVRAQLDLGRHFPDGSVSAATVNSSVLEAGNFTASEVEEARALCAFPASGS